jgi:hypothetical protein
MSTIMTYVGGELRNSEICGEACGVVENVLGSYRPIMTITIKEHVA